MSILRTSEHPKECSVEDESVVAFVLGISVSFYPYRRQIELTSFVDSGIGQVVENNAKTLLSDFKAVLILLLCTFSCGERKDTVKPLFCARYSPTGSLVVIIRTASFWNKFCLALT